MLSAVGIFAVVSALFVVVGVVFIAIGTRTRRTARAFEARAVRVPGLVTDLVLVRGPSSEPTSGYWVPVLEFTTSEGRPVRTQAMYGSVPAPARRGDQVAVLYDPEQPTRARVADRKLASGGCVAGASLLVGVLMLLLGLLLGAVTFFLSQIT